MKNRCKISENTDFKFFQLSPNLKYFPHLKSTKRMASNNQYQEADIDDDNVEMGLLKAHHKRVYTKDSAITLFAKTPVKNTQEYETLMIQERSLYLFWFFILAVASPLVFRYGMGSNVVDKTRTVKLKDLNNASLFVNTDWESCIECEGYPGMTLRNITIDISNVTNPNPNGNIPSIALFATQDFETW